MACVFAISFGLQSITCTRVCMCLLMLNCAFGWNRWLIFSAAWFALVQFMRSPRVVCKRLSSIHIKQTTRPKRLNFLESSRCLQLRCERTFRISCLMLIDYFERHSSLLQDVYVSIRTRTLTSCFANLRDCCRRRRANYSLCLLNAFRMVVLLLLLLLVLLPLPRYTQQEQKQQ